MAKELGSDGGLTFFLDLGLSHNQYQEAKRQCRDSGLAEQNTACLMVWCRSKARNASAMDKLKRALETKERLDIVEMIDELVRAGEEQPADNSQA